MPDIVFPKWPPPPHKKTANGNAVCYKCGDAFEAGTRISYWDNENQVEAGLSQDQEILMDDNTTVTVNVVNGDYYIASISG